jgi:hypothetical protein
MYSCLPVKHPTHLSDFSKIGVFSKIFVEVPNTKFNENPSSVSSAGTSGQNDGRGDGYDETNKRL